MLYQIKNWVFHLKDNNYILPLCVYLSKNSDNINQTKNIYVRVKKNKDKFEYPNLDLDLKDKNYYLIFQNLPIFLGTKEPNNYHPHEISASLFEDAICDTIYKKEHNGNKTNNLPKNSEVYNLLVDFFSNLN